MEPQMNELLTIAAVVAATAVGYGKAFGRYQFRIVEWVVSALAVRSRYRGVLNLAVGLVIATAYSGYAAWAIGDWRALALGMLAGVLASVEAADVHDGAPTMIEVAAIEADPPRSPTPMSAMRSVPSPKDRAA